jgi:hypothetical protein
MLRVLGRQTRACDGINRRELMAVGALSLFGGLTVASRGERSRPTGKARSVVLIDLFGGPSHIDTFDLKPAAPKEVRGEFRPIPSSVPGLQVCEHLPRMARMMHHICLIRSVTHGYNSHNPYAVMTGFTGGRDVENYFAKPSDHPGMGAVCQYLGVGRRRDIPGYVCLPAFPGYSQALRRAGPYGGFLGSQYDPLFSTCEPKLPRPYQGGKDDYDPTLIALGDPHLPSPQSGLTIDALDRRRTLLEQLDDHAAAVRGGRTLTERQRQVFDLLLSPRSRLAFDLEKEPPAVRDRYGRDLFGASVLLARRLVEAGVTFITVHTEAKGAGHWDTHENNFNMLKGALLPFLDRSLPALLDDLHQSGLLETTLVVVTGDMGRTPRINPKAGRDHWPQCGFCLLAGAGVKRGMVFGTTDRQAGYPLDHPVSPGDLVATIYERLGIDSEQMVPDPTGRPITISHGGQAIRDILT